ncbi:MAG: beta-ketoacyl synthase N-terminal-like domain-containing protein, partial [Verrucomicrobiota bacterium]
VDAESERYLERTWGMRALPTREGLEAFEALLQQDAAQVMVVYGLPSKMDKKLLRSVEKRDLATKAPGFDVKSLQSEAEKVMLQFAAELLKLDVAHLSADEELGDYGVDSILMTRFANTLNEYYGINLRPTVFFNYPTIGELSAYLAADYAEALEKQHDSGLAKADEPAFSKVTFPTQRFNGVSRRKRRVGTTGSVLTTTPSVPTIHEPIAIIGISGRFPGSPNLDVFWEQLRENKDLITEVPKDRWDWEAYYGDPQADKGKTKAKWGGFIEGIDQFDPLHFGISPREAELMDPQQRMALETVWHALEDAGIAPGSLKGSDTGIFVGVSSNDYSMLVHQHRGASTQAQFSTGSAHSVLVNRISYLLDIHGPSEPIDTACSSSLIAIHRAVEHLRHDHGKLAIAGGVNALLSPEVTLSFSEAGMLSEDGSCKTFDQRANGYVRGEGVGMVVLKSLSQAKADGDRIHAIIRSTSENHGGKANTLTSPNPKAQKDLLLKAYRQADIDPRRVSYIEAHGTGTALGDPVEVEGLKGTFKALYQERDLEEPPTPHIRLGSVKANIGHLESAAGIAGVLKVVLSMKHELLPGNPHLETPNEYLQLEGTPFALQNETTAWETNADEPRLAGVSSFGFGGANAHVVIEEYQEVVGNRNEEFRMEGPFIIPLSAKNEERLEEVVQNLVKYLNDPLKSEQLRLPDLAYTLQIGRESMETRLAMV